MLCGISVNIVWLFLQEPLELLHSTIERIINALDSKDIAQIDMGREITRLRELAKISRRFATTSNGRDHAIEPLLAGIKGPRVMAASETSPADDLSRQPVAAGSQIEES